MLVLFFDYNFSVLVVASPHPMIRIYNSQTLHITTYNFLAMSLNVRVHLLVRAGPQKVDGRREGERMDQTT